VHALARDFPDVAFTINGGINTLEEAVAIARGEGTPVGGGRLVGTMIGRRAHADPWGLLARADTAVFGEASDPCVSRRALLETYAAYADATWARYGTTKDGYAVPSIRHLMHPLQNLFLGEPNAKRWRREVDEVLKRDARRATTTVTGVLEETLRVLSDETLDRAPGEVGEARTLFEGSDVELPSRTRSAVVA
jgi:tRNA-dihydrouridine synthase A